MRILVIGGGGREHTLVWKMAQSPLVDKIYCISGNAGIAALAECEKIDVDGALEPIADFALDNRIDLTVVGPEDPLANGIVDLFAASRLRAFGPDQLATQIEASKIFSKELMWKYGIPTANAEIFDNHEEATAYIRDAGVPIVVKADGSAKGKGVIVCRDELQQALDAVNTIMVEKAFGNAGNRILVEECLEGEEASFIVFTDGENILPMSSSQDHKPIYDGDRGLNTGGMGAYSPAPVVTPEVYDLIMETIMLPTVKGMAAEGYPYKGVLYAGLMIADGKPKVIEFNARFGDPESQAVLPRLQSDIVPVMEACIDGTLDQAQLEWSDEAAACVVMASGGYPVKYKKGKVITGLDVAGAMENVMVFHAGTARQGGKIVTNGGRVLGVTALGKDIEEAVITAYDAVGRISFEGAYFRNDIAYRAL